MNSYTYVHVKSDSASINKGKPIDKRHICCASNVKCCDGSIFALPFVVTDEYTMSVIKDRSNI